ncbi:uncharacterized protein LOC106646352, partial [Copidosoma floridanum]|uniref:uncharacterized protein LOC106646352 n=1 Tax=Copidosoma floridanum TaxID=29053 RepID=UPI0006C9D9E0
LKDLLHRILADYSRLQRQEEVKLIWKTARYSRYVTLGVIILNKTSLYTQLVAHMIGPISCARKSNVCVTEDRPLYFIGSFPYSTQVSPNYELTVVGQIVSVFFASYTYSSSDSFYFVLIFHLVGQLSILKLLISELPITIKNGNQQYEFVKRFHNIHAHHNRLCKFHADIEDSFNMMFFMQLIPCIFVLCTQGYTLIMLTEAEKIPVMQLMYMIYFFILFLFTLFGYCYVAETLRQKVCIYLFWFTICIFS